MPTPPTVRVSIRYPTDTHTDAVAEARRAGWSLNTYTIRAVAAYTRRIHKRQDTVAETITTEDTTP